MLRRREAAVACAVGLALLSGRVMGVDTSQMGIFDTNGGGSCGYSFNSSALLMSGSYQGSISSNDPLIASLPNMGCGTCIRLTCNMVGNQAACKQGAKPIQMVVSDSCPSCQLNVPLEAFNQIAETNLGSVSVQVELVDCPSSGSLVARVLSFRPPSQAGSFLKLVFLNAAGSGNLRSVEIRSSSGSQDGSWVSMSSQYGAVWDISQLPTFPLDVRLTNVNNKTLLISRALPDQPTGDIYLPVNFAVDGAPRPSEAATMPRGAPAPAPSQVATSTDLTFARASLRRRSLLQFDAFGLSLGDLLRSFFPNTDLSRTPRSFQPPPSPFNLQIALPPQPSSPMPAFTLSTMPSSPGPSIRPIPITPIPITPSLAWSPVSPGPAVPALPPTATTLQPALPPSPVPAIQPPALAVTAPTAAPVNLQLAPALPTGSPCRQINDFIQQSPSLKAWANLLQGTGYSNSLAQPNVSITMFAPINTAFTDPVLLGTTVGNSNNVTSVNELLAADPSSANPLIGYHIIKGIYRSDRLVAGSVINTTDTLKQFGSNDQTLTVSVPSTGQIKGIGSTSTILLADVQACGPTIIHVVQDVLLPFSPSASVSSAAGPPSSLQATTG